MWQWIALAVVVVIILILVYGNRPAWRSNPGVSYTQGVKIGTTSQGNFQDLGGAGDPMACQKLCGDSDWCNAYTWTKDPAGDHSCMGVKNLSTAKITVGGNYTSGSRVSGFGAKLMHNLGMESAGAVGSGGAKEGFSAPQAPQTNRYELFSAPQAPRTQWELFSAPQAPQTNKYELFSAPQAPRTQWELFSAPPAPRTQWELFGAGSINRINPPPGSELGI
jgi:hypothetical protein